MFKVDRHLGNCCYSASINPMLFRVINLGIGKSVLMALLGSLIAIPNSFAQATEFKQKSRSSHAMMWEKLASLPDAVGFAGVFAGVSGKSLLVAGGANFPVRKPWEGGAKVWSDAVYRLDNPRGHWQIAGKLPRPLGYGVSVTVPEGVLCIGGSDSARHYSDVFLMNWIDNKLQFTSLPPLPEPCANFSGALLRNSIFVAGGIERPDSTNALKTFWALDLDRVESGWKVLEPWPGPERMLSVCGVQDGSFFLFSGAALKSGADGKPVRDWLRDAYCYKPASGWKKLPDLPRPTVAAPLPAPSIHGELYLFGGDDGTQSAISPTAHQGFSRAVLSYSPLANEWALVGELPFAFVTTVAVPWDDFLVIPGGEVRPGIRSTEVWTLPVK